MKTLYFSLILFTIVQCGPKKKDQDRSPEEIAMERFDGSFKLGDEYAIVYPMHLSFEVEVQFFAEPAIFFFDQLDKNGDFVYQSDDKSLSFIMQPDHKTGMFYEINEPPVKVVKE